MLLIHIQENLENDILYKNFLTEKLYDDMIKKRHIKSRNACHIKRSKNMSRFSEIKRKDIKERILMEGEKLFVEKGLKGVIVEDITEKVGIGKGTFYHFYENKEHLYLELYMEAQEKVFHRADDIIRDSRKKGMKEICYDIMLKIFYGFLSYPIIGQTDAQTWNQAARKVSKDFHKVNNDADMIILQKVQEAGVLFNYPEDVVMKLMQSTCLTAMLLQKTDKDMTITKILLEAVINQIVKAEGEQK